MTAHILEFPQRGPFSVRIERGDAAWIVTCRDHGWLHGDKRAAIADAIEIASGFGVALQVAS